MTGIDLDADPTDQNNGIAIISRAVSTILLVLVTPKPNAVELGITA
jgi:hypothetical protein